MQIRDFGSKMQQVARKTAPDRKTKNIKTKTKQNPKKNHHPSSSNFVPLLLQHTFKASDLVPDIFQTNTALQKIAFSQLPHSEVSLVYPSHFHIDSFRSLPFGLKFPHFQRKNDRFCFVHLRPQVLLRRFASDKIVVRSWARFHES